MRILRNVDVNTDGGSSSSSDTDVKTKATDSSDRSESLGSNDVNSELVDVATKALGESSLTKPDDDEKEKEQEGEVRESDGTEGEASKEGKIDEEPTEEKEKDPDSKDESEVSDEEKKEKTDEKVPDDKLPFGKHPRWQEMVKERNQLREQVTQFETKAKNFDQINGWCQQHNISGEQFNAALDMARLLNTDPAEAYKKLKPIVDSLAEMEGDRLPEDLAKEVEDGLLSEARAKEIAQLRGQKGTSAAKAKMTEEQQRQQNVLAMQNDLAAWETATYKSDPDFKPKASADEVDGKYELVVDKFKALLVTQPPRSSHEVVKLMQSAYDSVTKSLSRFKPAAPARKAIPSTKPSVATTRTKLPSSELEAAEQAMEKLQASLKE